MSAKKKPAGGKGKAAEGIDDAFAAVIVDDVRGLAGGPGRAGLTRVRRRRRRRRTGP